MGLCSLPSLALAVSGRIPPPAQQCRRPEEPSGSPIPQEVGALPTGPPTATAARRFWLRKGYRWHLRLPICIIYQSPPALL